MQGFPEESLVRYDPGHGHTAWLLSPPMVASPNSLRKNYSPKSTRNGDLIGGLPRVATLENFEAGKRYWLGAPPIDLSESCRQTLRPGTPYTLDRICGGLAGLLD